MYCVKCGRYFAGDGTLCEKCQTNQVASTPVVTASTPVVTASTNASVSTLVQTSTATNQGKTKVVTITITQNNWNISNKYGIFASVLCHVSWLLTVWLAFQCTDQLLADLLLPMFALEMAFVVVLAVKGIACFKQACMQGKRKDFAVGFVFSMIALASATPAVLTIFANVLAFLQ